MRTGVAEAAALLVCLALACSSDGQEYDLTWMPEGVVCASIPSHRLNHDGQVALSLRDADGSMGKAARWALGKPSAEPLVDPVPRWDGLRSSAINDLGSIAGTAESGGNHLAAAFLWQAREPHSIELLPVLASAQIAPSDINDRGWLLGEIRPQKFVLPGVASEPQDGAQTDPAKGNDRRGFIAKPRDLRANE